MEQDVYPTRDVYEASLLYANRLKLIDVSRVDSVCWFVFQGKDKAAELSRKFWSREAKVDAKAYAEAVKTLKDLIFAKRVG